MLMFQPNEHLPRSLGGSHELHRRLEANPGYLQERCVDLSAIDYELISDHLPIDGRAVKVTALVAQIVSLPPPEKEPNEVDDALPELVKRESDAH